METIQPYLDATWAFLSAGFNEANQAKPLLIALAATIFMQSWRQWFGVALLAVIVHIAVDVVVPVLAGVGEFRLPPIMTGEFWYLNASRFVGYLIVIAIFFAVKRVLFRGRAAAAH